MNAVMETLENKQVKLTITVPADRFEEGVAYAYRRNASRYVVAGFRKGKAPRKVVESYYGEGIFWDDAFRHVYPNAYDEAIEANGIDPVDAPDIDIVQIGAGQDLIFDATVTVKPEVTLGDYKGIKADREDDTVEDAAVNEELDKARERVARYEAAEVEAKEGDRVIIDYAGFIDDMSFEGGTAADQPLDIGAHQFIPGFEEQLVGAKAGEDKEIKVSFPDDYWSADLKGKEAIFRVKVKEVQHKELPELDDEFAKDVSSFDTLEEYKADLRKRLEDAARRKADIAYENAIIEKVADNAEVDIPDVMIERQIDHMVRDMETRLSYQGLKLADYLTYTNSGMTQMRESLKDEAKRNVKIQLVFDKIRTTENIEADEAGVDAKIAELAEKAGKTAEEYKATLPEDSFAYLAEQVMMDRLMAIIKGE